MKAVATILLFGLSFSPLLAEEPRVILSDKDFASFPEGGGNAPAWDIRAQGQASAALTDEVPGEGSNKRSLRLLDPEIEESTPPLDASLLLPSLDLASAKRIRISFEFRMANVPANSNLLFRVYKDAVNTPNYVGAIQFFNNWDGENGLRIGNAGSEIGKLEFDHWYRVTVELPLPGVEGTQSFTVTDLDNPDVTFSFSEKVPVQLNDYARLSFSSGFGDRRQLDAQITNISIQAIP